MFPLNRFFSRSNRRTPENKQQVVPVQEPADQALRRWLAQRDAPAYPWAELAANPLRVEAARLMVNGAVPKDTDPLLEQLEAAGAQRIDRMLRADTLLRQGWYERAVPLLAALAEGDDVWAARAALLLGEGRFDHGELRSAAALAEHAYALAPDAMACLLLLGNVRGSQGRHEEALALFRRALAQQPDSLLAIGLVSVTLMGQGALCEGLRHYVVADELIGAYPRQDVCPAWGGEPLGQQRLLIIGAYGHGDVMQFLRFVALLREREPAAHLSLMIEPPLARLAQETGWFDEIYTGVADRTHFDWQASTIRLPLGLGATMQDVRRFDQCLRIAPVDVAAADTWLAPRTPGRKRIGLRWAGRQMHFDAKRSIPFAHLMPLFEVPGIDWVALVEDEEALAALGDSPLRNVSAHLTDLYATGALMEQLDLVISADTSTVHLAGSLGRPAWLLARPDYEWRWGDSGASTPWYGSLRIFRHPPGEFDWKAVVGEATVALREWVER